VSPPEDDGLGAADGPVPPVGVPVFGGAVEGAGAGGLVVAVVAPGLPVRPEPDDWWDGGVRPFAPDWPGDPDAPGPAPVEAVDVGCPGGAVPDMPG
jgi:hypothetical protein